MCFEVLDRKWSALIYFSGPDITGYWPISASQTEASDWFTCSTKKRRDWPIFSHSDRIYQISDRFVQFATANHVAYKSFHYLIIKRSWIWKNRWYRPNLRIILIPLCTQQYHNLTLANMCGTCKKLCDFLKYITIVADRN